MPPEFINLTAENLVNEHLCCIICSQKPHPGVEAKRQWLSEQLKEGHVFRKLNERATVMELTIYYTVCSVPLSFKTLKGSGHIARPAASRRPSF